MVSFEFSIGIFIFILDTYFSFKKLVISTSNDIEASKFSRTSGVFVNKLPSKTNFYVFSI